MLVVPAGVRLDGSAVSALIRLAVRKGEAQAAFSAGLRPSLDTFAAQLQACAKDGRAELADTLFASLPHWRLRPNRALYSAMLECHARAGRAVRVEQLYQQMQAYES